MTSAIRTFSRIAGCALLAGSFAAGASQPEAALARKVLSGLPVVFEPNQGQWSPQVKFSARTGDCRVFLTARGAVLSFSQPGAGSPRQAAISMLNANRAAAIEGVDPLPSRGNYFLGNRKENWHAGVSQFGRVRYQGVYPGIDVVYYGNQSQLEYDFILHPGADPGRIRVKFDSAGHLTLTPSGDLVLEEGGARLVQKRPYVYQQDPRSPVRRQVEGRYRLLGRNTVAVEVASYDRSLPLTIDPVLVYSSMLGGGLADAITAVKVTESGMIYVAGYTANGDIAATDGVHQTVNNGGQDVFVAKIDPTQSGLATVAAFTYLGGTGSDIATGLALDPAGNVYLTGYTTSTDFPTAGDPQQSALSGDSLTDAFVVEISSGLDWLMYSTYLGGTDVDRGNGIDVDASGAIYVVGSTRSGDFPLTDSAYQPARWGPLDAFIVKLIPGASPQLVYSSFLGGELNDDGRAIAVTPSGMVYFAGSTNSTTFPLEGFNYRAELAGAIDIFVAQMDLTKSGVPSLVYSTYFGGSDIEEVRGLALDPSGKVLLTGYTLSSDFPLTPDALQRTLGGNADAFIAKLDLTAPPASVVTYATYLGGSHGDVGYGIASDPAGDIYVTGYTMSKDFPVTGDAWQPSYGGGVNSFITKLSPALVYSTYLGGSGVNIGYAITAGKDGTIYAAGITGFQGIPVTGNAYLSSFAGGTSDGYIVVLAP